MKKSLAALSLLLLAASPARASDCAGCVVWETVSTNRAGIGTTQPVSSWDLSGTTDALALPAGTIAQRPVSAVNGEIRYNASTPGVEAFISGAWQPMASGASGNASQWVNGTSGTIYYPGTYVGIGTPTPGAPLQLYTTSNFVFPASSGSGIPTGTILSVSGGDVSINEGIYTSGTTWIQSQRISNNASNFSLVLNPNGGSIGIGTTSPDATVHIRGATNENLLLGGNYIIPGAIAIASVNDANSAVAPMEVRASLFDFETGNVGIGTTNPISTLHVLAPGNSSVITMGNCATGHTCGTLGTSADTGGVLALQSNGNVGTSWGYLTLDANGGNVGIGLSNPSSYTLQVNGSVAGTSNYVNTSDVRLKKNITPIAYGLDTVLKLRPVGFSWNPDMVQPGRNPPWKKQHQLGLIAQEVEPVVPEVVSTAEDKMKTKSLAYSELVPVLIKAVQDEQAEIDQLKAQLTALQALQLKPAASPTTSH